MQERRARNQSALHRKEFENRHPAFTLIELLVVLIIIAMLSSIVAIQLSSYFSNASISNALDRLKMLDSAARREAGVQPSGTVVMELRRQVQGERKASRYSGFRPPTGVVIKSIWITGADGRFRSVESDPVYVNFSSTGTSEDYAIEFAGRGGVTQGLLVLGLSGQVLLFHDADDLQELL